MQSEHFEVHKMHKFGCTLRSNDQGKTNTKDTKTRFKRPVLLSSMWF
jgi:hypothetical protein